MTTEEDNDEREDFKPLINQGIIKWLAILFVLSVYLLIFLKILFLQ